MRHYFLCVESDTLAEASRHHNKREALAAFREVADEFVRFGNMPPLRDTPHRRQAQRSGR